MPFVNKEAKVICTVCPIPTSLAPNQARTVKIANQTIVVDADSKLSPNFSTCLIVPSAPKPCSPSLTGWTSKAGTVTANGKALLMFPSSNQCANGGNVSMVYAGQLTAGPGATSQNSTNKHCNWTECDSKHSYDIHYRNDGTTTRKTLTDWVKPDLIYKTVYRTTPMGTKTASNYSTRRHHVIAVNSFESMPKLCHNLKLLGFDINNEMLNGMILPFATEDIVWHDLQFHRGSHPIYDGNVESLLKDMEKKYKTIHFCRTEEQIKLWELVEDCVKECREKILNWTWPLHSNSLTQRPIEFGHKSDARSIPLPSKRKYYF